MNRKRFLAKKIPGVFPRRFPGGFNLEKSLGLSPVKTKRIATSQDSKTSHLREGNLGGLFRITTNEWLQAFLKKSLRGP